MAEPEDSVPQEVSYHHPRWILITYEVVKFTVLALIVVLPIRYFVAQPFVVQGASMDPHLKQGDYLVIDKISSRSHDPKYGDVIVFKNPLDTSVYFVKRVIGMPGDTLKVSGDHVSIRDRGTNEFVSLTEPYAVYHTESYPGVLYEEVTLEEDEYFMMGDNRLHSSDSRMWGPLRKKYIIGHAFMRLYPFSQIEFNPAGIDAVRE